jgi:Ca2+/H+ antiporter, TMEM165/GDT1 family
MDLKLALSTFGVVFLAELGDKTQIAVFTLAAGSKSRWSVMAGASLALITSSLIAVLVADQVAKHVGLRWTQGIAGAVLVALGVIYLVGAVRVAG